MMAALTTKCSKNVLYHGSSEFFSNLKILWKELSAQVILQNINSLIFFDLKKVELHTIRLPTLVFKPHYIVWEEHRWKCSFNISVDFSFIWRKNRKIEKFSVDFSFIWREKRKINFRETVGNWNYYKAVRSKINLEIIKMPIYLIFWDHGSTLFFWKSGSFF